MAKAHLDPEKTDAPEWLKGLRCFCPSVPTLLKGHSGVLNYILLPEGTLANLRLRLFWPQAGVQNGLE